MNNCELVVFSDRAYNAIIRETFDWDPIETGGILLGHILDNGCWIVMEVLPPGYSDRGNGNQVVHDMGYFEYNQRFVNYLAKSVAEQYEQPLELLGLWHRHPGSMDHFSGTDDGTNTEFSLQNPNGVISGLVNVDPQFRLTMYYLPQSHETGFNRPSYQEVQIEVGSDLIPEEYFKLRHYKGEVGDLHPFAPQRPQRPSRRGNEFNQTPNSRTQDCTRIDANDKHIDTKRIVSDQLHQRTTNDEERNFDNEHITVADDIIEKLKKNKLAIIVAIATFVFILSLWSIKSDISRLIHVGADQQEQSKENINLGNEDEQSLKAIEDNLQDKKLEEGINKEEVSTETKNTSDVEKANSAKENNAQSKDGSSTSEAESEAKKL